jgi:hypothetical protein
MFEGKELQSDEIASKEENWWYDVIINGVREERKIEEAELSRRKLEVNNHKKKIFSY